MAGSGRAQDSTQQPQTESNYQPPTYPGQIEKDDGEWRRPAKDYASTRYSSLDQITRANAKDLKVVATFSTGLTKGEEAAPLVIGDTLYVITPFPNKLYALDLGKPGFPLKWTYDPLPTPASQGEACCDVVNRGGSYYDGKIFYNTLDDQTVSVDAKTGREVWKVRVGDINRGETLTMAPLVVKGKVLVGISGGEMGVRGWLEALDAKDGKLIWRAYSTGPDKDVLIGPNFKPFYAKDRGQDLGVKTWPPDAWRIGGGSVWGWISYDADLNLIYYGTSNPGPWNAAARPGDNKWTAGIFARNPDTGEAVWYYQYSPHDTYDYDGVNENVLVDLKINNQVRKVILHPDRNGYVYVIDRTDGQVIEANPFVPITTSTGVNLQTGQLQYVADKATITGKVVRDLCPTAPGAKDWQPSAFSPRTGLLYIPHNNLCMDKEDLAVNYIAGTPYVGANVRMYNAPGGYGGAFTAWDPVTGKIVWNDPDMFPVWSGALATAGDVVFYGTMEGWFKAVDANTGKVLWQFKTGSGVIGQPVTFKAPDGKQYVAVLAGVGGWSGAIVSGALDPRDTSAALGFAGVMKDLPKYTAPGGTLYVFALP